MIGLFVPDGLTDGGVTIFDNSNRKQPASDCEHLHRVGFRRLEFFRLRPDLGKRVGHVDLLSRWKLSRFVTRRKRSFVSIHLSRLVAVAALVLAAHTSAWAAGRNDVAYGPAGAENTLDIRYQAGEARPLIVFVHGGGWSRGDKRTGTRLLAPFSSSYAYASINYRLAPAVTLKESAQDVAVAVAYLQQHAAEFGIDPKRVFLMGHSAGAHLAALVGVDPEYFAAAGVSPDSIRGVVLLDCGGCNPEVMARNPDFRAILGADPKARTAYSPVSFAGKIHRPPPFMITYSPDRERSSGNAKPLAAALEPQCGVACVLKPYSKEHMSFLRDLAVVDDPLTKDVMAFLSEQLKR